MNTNNDKNLLLVGPYPPPFGEFLAIYMNLKKVFKISLIFTFCNLTHLQKFSMKRKLS